MEAMECREAVSAGTGLGQGSSDLFALTDPSALTDNPQAMLTVVVEVESGRRSGKKRTHSFSEAVQPGRASWERERARPS